MKVSGREVAVRWISIPVFKGTLRSIDFCTLVHSDFDPRPVFPIKVFLCSGFSLPECRNPFFIHFLAERLAAVCKVKCDDGSPLEHVERSRNRAMCPRTTETMPFWPRLRVYIGARNVGIVHTFPAQPGHEKAHKTLAHTTFCHPGHRSSCTWTTGSIFLGFRR